MSASNQSTLTSEVPASRLRRVVEEQTEKLARIFGADRIPREPDSFFRSRYARGTEQPFRFFIATYVIEDAGEAHAVVHTVTFVMKNRRSWVPVTGYVRHRPFDEVCRQAYSRLDKMAARFEREVAA